MTKDFYSYYRELSKGNNKKQPIEKFVNWFEQTLQADTQMVNKHMEKFSASLIIREI